MTLENQINENDQTKTDKTKLSKNPIIGCAMIPIVAGFIGIPTLLAAGCTANAISHLDRDVYSVKVVGTERIAQDESSYYLVLTVDAETNEPKSFANIDSLLEWKFNSSDYQVVAEDAKNKELVCDVKTYGWRVPALSLYENIIKLDCQ